MIAAALLVGVLIGVALREAARCWFPALGDVMAPADRRAIRGRVTARSRRLW